MGSWCRYLRNRVTCRLRQTIRKNHELIPSHGTIVGFQVTTGFIHWSLRFLPLNVLVTDASIPSGSLTFLLAICDERMEFGPLNE
jgi:hypothetical protein